MNLGRMQHMSCVPRILKFTPSEQHGKNASCTMQGEWQRWCVAGMSAGAIVGLIDAAMVVGPGMRRFAGVVEWTAFAVTLAGLCALSCAVVACGLYALMVAGGKLPPRWKRVMVHAVGIIAGLAGGLAIFSGSAMRRSPVRPWAMTASAVVGAMVVRGLWTRRAVIRAIVDRERVGLRLVLLALSAVLYLVHAFVLVRLYPWVHLALASGAVAALVCSLALAWTDARLRPSLVVGGLVVGFVGAVGLMHRQAWRAMARQQAPVGSYFVRAVGWMLPGGASRVVVDDRLVRGRSLDFRGLDIVLLTVDALRADRVGAYGGPSGLTPTLDGMAARGVVVERAYCTTPHTSYSLASLMTGKYFHQTAALGEPSRPHETLAGHLARTGYVTAGFYPPAVFSVDAERLGDLRTRGFDFRYRHEAYRDAMERVREVEDFLVGVPSSAKLFIWVHLFEPHEPYETHAGGRVAGNGGPRERYDAEVAVVDDAIAALRQLFDRRGRRAVWIVTADHGEEFGDHGGRFHGTTLYEEQVRVPLVIYGPGVPVRRVAGPASLVDVMPTVLAALGLPRPPRLRGRDLGPLIYGQRWNHPVYASVGSERMIVMDDDKLICDVSEGSCELFDLRTDPHERANLVDVRSSRVAALRPLLEGWQESHGRFEREGEGAASAIPPVVERALQGDVSAAPAVARLLDSLSEPVARRAIAALAALQVQDASVRDALARVMEQRTGPLAQEAGIALALLGDARGESIALAALASPDVALARRAALGLARRGRREGVPLLLAWVTDPSATDDQRDAVVSALADLNDPRSFDVWVALLEDPRLAPAAARALGALGDPRATAPLARTESSTRYALTRRECIAALAALGDRSALARFRAALTGDEPLPQALSLAAVLGEPGRRIAGTSSPVVFPQGRGRVLLRGPMPRGRAWVIVSLRSESAVSVRIGAATVAIPAGESETRVALERVPAALPVVAPGPVQVRGVLVVPRTR